MSKVAIIITCYNLGKYLEEAIDSALNQTYQNLEVIVIDDGSDDPSTLSLLATLDRQNVRLFRTPNQGLAAARNYGIAQSDAPFILPLDADDRIAPTLVAEAVEIINSDSTVGIVSCEAEFFGLVSGPWQLPPLRFPDLLITPALFATALFRRTDWEQVGGYKAEMIHGYEDHEFWLSLLELGRHPHRIPEPLFQYRQREGSMSARIDPDQKRQSFRTCLQYHSRLFAENLPFLLDQFVEQNEARRAEQRAPHCQVFFAHKDGFNEECSIRSSFPPGEPVLLTLESPPLAPAEGKQLRIDPGDRPGVYRIWEIEIRAKSEDILILKASAGELKSLVVDTGDGLMLPSDEAITFLSYGNDPRLLLQDPRLEPTIQTWKVFLRIQYDPELGSARDGLDTVSRQLYAFSGLI